jgi:membrane protein
MILFAATGMFVQLQLALNAIWGVQPKPGRSIWNMVRSRFLAFVLVFLIGALLILALTAQAALVTLRRFVPAALGSADASVLEGVDWILLIVIQTLLVAVIFKLLPDVQVAWRNVWAGALLTSLLFLLGDYLFSQYLWYAAPASVYGPAGSLVVVMLWVYYSSQILLFGAVFTKQFASRFGKPVEPAPYAMCRPR